MDEADRIADRETVLIEPRRPLDDSLSRRDTVRLTPGRGRRRAPIAIAAVVAALSAGIASYLPVLALIAMGGLGGGGDLKGVLRFAAAGWLLAHGVPLQTPADRVSLVPLAVSAVAVWRLSRAGLHASRAIGGPRARLVRPSVAAPIVVALAYAGLGATVAALAGTPGLKASPLRSAVTFGLFALVAALAGALTRSRAIRLRLKRLSPMVRGGVRTGLVATALMVAAGAGAAGLSLAVRGGEAAEMLGSYRVGLLGQAGLTMICLVYAPNVAIWATAYLLGPGFAVGVGTSVSPGAVVLGPLPALPVLAGLPDSAASGPLAGLLAVPLGAAMAAGWLLVRRRLRVLDPGGAPSWPAVLVPAALAGPVAGVLLGLAAVASSGSLGSGRLTQIGPEAWRVALFGTGVVAAGAVVGAAISRVLLARR